MPRNTLNLDGDKCPRTDGFEPLKNMFCNRQKLTSYHINEQSTYIPPNIKTCAELLLTNKGNSKQYVSNNSTKTEEPDLFSQYLEPKQPENIKNTYNSNIQPLTNSKDPLLKRTDMFNTQLTKL